MRRKKSLSVRVRAPSRGLVSRVPSETADQMPAQSGIVVPGTPQRAASRASNVRYEDGVVCNAPGTQKIKLESGILVDMVAAWALDELDGNRADKTGNEHTLIEVTGSGAAGETTKVISEVGQLDRAALFPALDNIGKKADYAALASTLKAGSMLLAPNSISDSKLLSASLKEGALVSAICPVVEDYPDITWTDGQGGIPVSGTYDSVNKCLWIYAQALVYPDTNRIWKVTTQPFEYVASYHTPGSPSCPVGQTSFAYDPIHNRLVGLGQAYGYIVLDPEEETLGFAGAAAWSSNGGYRQIACDTLRGHIIAIGSNGTDNQQFQVGQIEDDTFESLHVSDVSGIVYVNPVYSDGADKYVLLAKNHNPALYYVHPTTYEVTASTIDLASKNSSSSLIAYPGTSMVGFVDSGSKFALVNVETDTLLNHSNSSGDVCVGTYDSCSNRALFYRVGDGIYAIDLSDYSMEEVAERYGPVLGFNPYTNLVYCATNDMSPFSVFTL